MDALKNLAYSTVAAAPAPASSGTSLDVTSGQGSRFPTPPFNATVWATGANPIPSNAEIVRVTAISTDTLTIVREQEGSSARSVIVGDQIAATLTKKYFDDLQLSLPVEYAGDPNGNLDGNKARLIYDTSNERQWRKTTDAGTLTGWV
jgi:hypothetical protein